MGYNWNLSKNKGGSIMNKITNLIKSKIIVSIVVMLTLIMAQISLVAYADNGDGTVKAVMNILTELQ